ncbi:hypothetical protein [Klugiella xanthotipulae]|nr:hypothetical protein [Klugiella xanthotipulae]
MPPPPATMSEKQALNRYAIPLALGWGVLMLGFFFLYLLTLFVSTERGGGLRPPWTPTGFLIFTLVYFALVLFTLPLPFAKLHYVAKRNVTARYRSYRDSIQPWADAHRWVYQSDSGSPPLDILYATFSPSRWIRVWNTTHVVTGTHRSYSFTSAHIVGYHETASLVVLFLPLWAWIDEDARAESKRRPRFRDADMSENIVVLQLPHWLPPFRLTNNNMSSQHDYGDNLPHIAARNNPLNERWVVQSADPRFIQTMMTPEVVRVLLTAPPLLCSIAQVNGQLVAYRNYEGSALSIYQQLELLTALANRLPVPNYPEQQGTPPH